MAVHLYSFSFTKVNNKQQSLVTKGPQGPQGYQGPRGYPGMNVSTPVTVVIYNVTFEQPLSPGIYYDSISARNAVPLLARKHGLILLYCTAENNWTIEQYISSNINDWLTDINYKNISNEAGLTKWIEKPFRVGNVVYHNGNLYEALYNTLVSDEPGQSEKWLAILDLNNSNVDFVYSASNNIQTTIGYINKGENFANGIYFSELLNRIFYPNYQKPFPEKPIYFGISTEYPMVDVIQNLKQPKDFYEFDIIEYMSTGYVIIALPGNIYLSRIDDSNGINNIGAFELVYKSIHNEHVADIYNVYISPKLFWNDILELAFFTKIGNPIIATLDSVYIEVANKASILNSVSYTEATKSILKSISYSNRRVDSILNSVSYLQDATVLSIINNVEFNSVYVTSILNSISYNEGIRCILNSVSYKDGRSLLNSVLYTEATKSILNSVSYKDGRSLLNSVFYAEATKPILNSVSYKDGRSILNNISYKDGRSILNEILYTEATKSILNSVSYTEAI